MQLALIVGSATATVKHPSLNGCKLLVAQPVMADESRPDGDPQLVVDRLGAGPGDMVIITGDGNAAAEVVGDELTPVRWITTAIRNA